MKKKLIKNKGILFWITGLAGSGKTSLAIKIHKKMITKCSNLHFKMKESLTEIDSSLLTYRAKETKI